jgi:hypothetical protein
MPESPLNTLAIPDVGKADSGPGHRRMRVKWPEWSFERRYYATSRSDKLVTASLR